MATTPSPADPSLAHRRTRARLRVLDADGAPLARTEVTVEQTRHAFGFGNIGFDLVALANGETGAAPDSPFGGAADASQLADLWLDLFDTATLPFYWGGFEPVRGRARHGAGCSPPRGGSSSAAPASRATRWSGTP